MGRATYGFAPLNLLLVIVVFWLVLLIPWFELWGKPVVRRAAARAFRPLKPKTGADCSLYHGEQGASVNEESITLLPRPWWEGWSRRGRRKASMTEGYFCDNTACRYHGITDQAVHALVADGTQGNTNAFRI
jgi:hypothetical protein